MLFKHLFYLEGRQSNLTGIIYAVRPISWRKNGKNRWHTFWANWTQRTNTNWKQFWLSVISVSVTQGHHRWYHSTEDKISHIFFSLDRMPLLCRSGVTAKKTKFQKTKVGCYGIVLWKFVKQGSDRSSTPIAEPDGETAWKSVQSKLR